MVKFLIFFIEKFIQVHIEKKCNEDTTQESFI